jgi:LPS-assembly protein
LNLWHGDERIPVAAAFSRVIGSELPSDGLQGTTLTLRFVLIPALLIAAGLGLFAQEVIPSQRQTGDLEVYAVSQEMAGDTRQFRGSVEFRLNNVVLTCEELDYNETTGDVEARGHVHYRNLASQEDLFAEKVAYNSKSESGTFYQVHGTVASASQGGFRLLTTENPFYIEGEIVQKTKDHYVVHDGFVTNCERPGPWWTMRAPKTTIVPGQSATIHNGVFRLRKLPLLYFPYYRKSLERMPRHSGFLTPNFGNSSRFGLLVGQSYFWAINRSYDATVGGTWYTDRGFASQIDFRGRPTANSTFDAYFFGVKDRGLELPNCTPSATDDCRHKQGGTVFTMKGTALLPWGLRGVANVNVLSSLEFRQAFTQSFEEAIWSRVLSIGYVSKNFSTFSLNTSLSRDANFQSLRPDDTVVIRKFPNFEFNSLDHQFVQGAVPLWFSFDTSFDLLSRDQPSFETADFQQLGFETRNFVQRGDFYPRVSTKFDWKGFHIRPTLGARQTSYGQSLETGINRPVGRNLYRTTVETSVEVFPPAIERIYNGPKWLGDRVKHVIEPRLTYRYVDGVEDFDRIVRFDERDIVNNTNEAEISLTNRLFAKNDKTGQVNEVFSLEVWQRRYFDPEFGGAIVPGRRNVFVSTIDSTPFAFVDQPRNYSPVSTSMKFRPTWRYTLEWRNDYDPLRGKLVNSRVGAGAQFDRWNVSVSHNAVRSPTALAPPSNQIRTSIRWGDFNRRGWNAAVASIYDYRQKSFLYTISQITYNTDCCGFSVEWRRLPAFGQTPNDNQFRASLSIANVGSFGTLRPQERLF